MHHNVRASCGYCAVRGQQGSAVLLKARERWQGAVATRAAFCLSLQEMFLHRNAPYECSNWACTATAAARTMETKRMVTARLLLSLLNLCALRIARFNFRTHLRVAHRGTYEARQFSTLCAHRRWCRTCFHVIVKVKSGRAGERVCAMVAAVKT